jgi:hypothetical protein
MILSTDTQQQIADACVTVHIGKDGFGRGVLVGGGLVMTAAHNVILAIAESSPRSLDDALVGLALGDHTPVAPRGQRHGTVYAQPYAIEPVTDIAVLACVDGGVFFDEALAYEAWCEATTPVPLQSTALPLRSPFPVAVYTHHGDRERGGGRGH